MITVRLKRSNDLYPYSNWIEGVFEYRKREYTFCAECFPEPSEFGINCGHVSKLHVRSVKTHDCVINYDRGHDYGDESMYDRGMIKELIDYLSDYVRRVPMQ